MKPNFKSRMHLFQDDLEHDDVLVIMGDWYLASQLWWRFREKDRITSYCAFTGIVGALSRTYDIIRLNPEETSHRRLRLALVKIDQTLTTLNRIQRQIAGNIAHRLAVGYAGQWLPARGISDRVVDAIERMTGLKPEPGSGKADLVELRRALAVLPCITGKPVSLWSDTELRHLLTASATATFAMESCPNKADALHQPIFYPYIDSMFAFIAHYIKHYQQDIVNSHH